MKKIKTLIVLLFVFLIVGCSSTIKQSQIKGYWALVERDWSGEITDMSKDPYTYLEITDKRLFFYYESTEYKGYYDSLSEKYYILEDNKIYYDYYELKGKNWKDNINELYGGIFYITLDDNKLILTEYYNDENEDDGYEKETYIKVKDEDRLLDL